MPTPSYDADLANLDLWSLDGPTTTIPILYSSGSPYNPDDGDLDLYPLDGPKTTTTTTILYGSSSPYNPDDGDLDLWSLDAPGLADGSTGGTTLPYDLSAAIIARYKTITDGTFSGIKLHKDRAGERTPTPYIVFRVKAGPTILTADTVFIYDQQVTFEAYAETQDQANLIREQIHGKFGKYSYDFQTGFSIPFHQKNRMDRDEQGRGPNAAYRYMANIDYSARTHRGAF